MPAEYEIIPGRAWIKNDPGYQGRGRSARLARGLCLWVAGTNQTGEGMGLGAVALGRGRQTFFAAAPSPAEDQLDQAAAEPFGGGPGPEAGPAFTWRRDYALDRVAVKTLGGVPVPGLTLLGHLLVALYMRFPWLQRSILHPRLLTAGQRAFRIGSGFRRIPPLARCRMHYTLRPGEIAITGEVNWQGQPPHKIYLLNELSSAFLDSCWQGGQWLPPPTGWEAANTGGEEPWLASSAGGIALQGSPATCSWGEVEKYLGREAAGDLAWAGIIYQITLPHRRPEGRTAVEFSYQLKVRDLDGSS